MSIIRTDIHFLGFRAGIGLTRSPRLSFKKEYNGHVHFNLLWVWGYWGRYDLYLKEDKANLKLLALPVTTLILPTVETLSSIGDMCAHFIHRQSHH